MISHSDVPPGSRPARRADGAPWLSETLAERPAPLASGVRVRGEVSTTTPVTTGPDASKSRQSGHPKKTANSPDTAGKPNKANVPTREETAPILPNGPVALMPPEPAAPLQFGPATAFPPVSKVETAESLPARLGQLLRRCPDGLTARDVLRARIAPDAAASLALLELLATAGHLARRESRPANGGKAVVTFTLPQADLPRVADVRQ